MRVKIDRDTCGAHLAFCEQCLGKFLREPYGYERRCFVELEEDGREELTIELHSGDSDTVLVLNEEERKLAASEGWSFFVDFLPPMYRNHVFEKEDEEIA